MSIRKMTALCTAAAFAAIGFASPAAAQATRTWVSGVGDDVNPCSRTAPCKTFAGAISKTAAGGEINCLDPGGFGAVTITKSLTIDCHYTEGGALAGGNGIVVNAAATDVVVLRGLDIFGVSPPTHGVRIIAGGAVSIEDCVIRRFNSANSFGISFQPTGTTNLYVTNTTITQNGNGATGGGINIAPTGASGVGRVSIKNTNVLQNSGRGISVDMSGGTGPGIAATIDESVISGTSGDGIAVVTPGPGINVMVTNSSVTNNSTNGIIGVGAGAVIRVGDTTITGNAFAGGAGVVSVSTYGDNRLDANANNGTFNAPALVKR